MNPLLRPTGLALWPGGDVLPLRAGAMHYFHHSPVDWEPGLDAIVSMKLGLVDIYVPWGWHEVEAGKFDFGFAVDWMRKDLGLVLDEASRNGAKLDMTDLVDGYYADVQAMGGKRWDTSSLIARLEKPKR